MEILILILVLAVIIGIVILMMVNIVKKDPAPTPKPPHVPSYLGFLNNVETVIRNPLSDEELNTYFESIKLEYERYRSAEPDIVFDFNKLLTKYNIPYPYSY
jgi:hypothetical protein